MAKTKKEGCEAVMFKNKDVDGVFVMPKEVLKFVNNAKKAELRLIMYIFAKGDSFSVEQAAQDLSESVDMINSALSFWRGTGLVQETNDGVAVTKKPRKIQEPKQDEYSTLDVANARADMEFDHIVKHAESTLGTLLNASKQAQLLYLYDNLGMQSDVIIGIISYCAANDKKQMSYIKNTAVGIHNDGVATYKELESYLKAKEDYHNFENAVKRIVGAGDRALTASEKKLVERWERELEVDEEMLSLAYERTITLISKPSLPYMSKILESWHNDGIKTADEARANLEKLGHKFKQDKENERAKKAEKARNAGFDIEFEDIFEKP